MPYEAQTDDDKRLAARFLALEGLPKNTYGRQFWAHFREHGFEFPGQPTADAATGPEISVPGNMDPYAN